MIHTKVFDTHITNQKKMIKYHENKIDLFLIMKIHLVGKYIRKSKVSKQVIDIIVLPYYNYDTILTENFLMDLLV